MAGVGKRWDAANLYIFKVAWTMCPPVEKKSGGNSFIFKENNNFNKS